VGKTTKDEAPTVESDNPQVKLLSISMSYVSDYVKKATSHMKVVNGLKTYFGDNAIQRLTPTFGHFLPNDVLQTLGDFLIHQHSLMIRILFFLSCLEDEFGGDFTSIMNSEFMMVYSRLESMTSVLDQVLKANFSRLATIREIEGQRRNVHGTQQLKACIQNLRMDLSHAVYARHIMSETLREVRAVFLEASSVPTERTFQSRKKETKNKKLR
jgi:hypothetical protein